MASKAPRSNILKGSRWRPCKPQCLPTLLKEFQRLPPGTCSPLSFPWELVAPLQAGERCGCLWGDQHPWRCLPMTPAVVVNHSLHLGLLFMSSLYSWSLSSFSCSYSSSNDLHSNTYPFALFGGLLFKGKDEGSSSSVKSKRRRKRTFWKPYKPILARVFKESKMNLHLPASGRTKGAATYEQEPGSQLSSKRG